MSESVPVFTDSGQVAVALETMSDEELTEVARQQKGGIDGFLDLVFAGAVEFFDAERAAGESADVQYEVTTPEGVHPYAMHVADGKCTIERGTTANPRVTLRAKLPDLLRIMLGKSSGVQAFMSGRLKISGDLFFAQTQQSWFRRP